MRKWLSVMMVLGLLIGMLSPAALAEGEALEGMVCEAASDPIELVPTYSFCVSLVTTLLSPLIP